MDTKTHTVCTADDNQKHVVYEGNCYRDEVTSRENTKFQLIKLTNE